MKWMNMIRTILFPFSMIIGPLLMKVVNEYDLSEQLKFQNNELNCSIISGSHVLSKVKKKTILGWNCSSKNMINTVDM